MAGFAIPENASLKDVLEALDTWGVRSAVKAEGLWAVLTALRGPDNGDDTLKAATTVYIRGASLPKVAARAGAFVAFRPGDLVSPMLSNPARPRLKKPFDVYGNHFINHYHRAANALNIPAWKEDEE